jgi:hypothetical protein
MLQDALSRFWPISGRFHSLLSDYVRANDILKGHFEDYQVLVNERIFPDGDPGFRCSGSKQAGSPAG